jgi:hypothetical protein
MSQHVNVALTSARRQTNSLLEVLQNSTSHSPQALAWGHSGMLNFGNRFNGFRRGAEIVNISM